MKWKNVNGRRRGESSWCPHDRKLRYGSPHRVFKLSSVSLFQRTKKRQKTNMRKTHTSMQFLTGSTAIH